MKGILKVVYIVFAVIAAVIVYFLGYNSNSVNHIVNLTNKAIESQNYVEVAKIHGGCFDINNLATEDSDDFDIAIFPATTLIQYSYYETEESETPVTKAKYDQAYYIYVFNPKFSLTPNEVDGLYLNDAGIKFKSASGSYNYKFQITETINKDDYNEKPLTFEDALLNGKRESVTYYENWNFINVTLTRSLINTVASQLKGDINSIDILDKDGEAIYTIDVKLDFSQEFFADVNDLCVEYNKFVDVINSKDATDEEKESADKAFETFYVGTEDTPGFEEEFLKNENYSFRYADGYLQPGSLVWQTIGLIALFIAAAALLYFLLFHFAFIKEFIARQGRGNGKYRVNPGANRRTNSINAKVNEVKEKPAKAEPKKEEAPAVVETPAEKEAPVVEAEVVETPAAEEAPVVEAEVVEKAPEASTEEKPE